MNGGALRVNVKTLSADAVGVVVAYVQNLASTTNPSAPAQWRSFDLQSAGNGQWSGSSLLSGCTSQLDYLVQIYDAAGNVRVMSNKAAGFVTECTNEPPVVQSPDLTAVPVGTPNANGVYTAPVSVQVSTTLSGPFFVDNGSGQPVRFEGLVTGPVAGIRTFSFPIVGEGLRTYDVTAFGSTLSATGNVLIDTAGASPVVSILSPTGSVAAGSKVPIVFSCEDVSLVSCVGTLTPAGGSSVPVESGTSPVLAAGTYTLSVTGTDAVSPPTTKTFAFDVVPAAPSIITIAGPTVPAPVGATSTVSVEFADAEGSLDDYTVTFDWGQNLLGAPVADDCVARSGTPGATSTSSCSLVEPSGTQPGTATASVRYPSPGVYTVTVTVEDKSMLQATATHQFVVIYDPGAGRVAGSGVYWSDRESFMGNGPRWGSLGLFGYTARYRAGDTTPIGQTSLSLLGGFGFKSTSYDYLVINSTVAVAEGVGKVNGVAGYRMRVQGIDNGRYDFFQITIWNDDGVLYDNGILYEDLPADVRDEPGDRVPRRDLDPAVKRALLCGVLLVAGACSSGGDDSASSVTPASTVAPVADSVATPSTVERRELPEGALDELGVSQAPDTGGESTGPLGQTSLALESEAGSLQIGSGTVPSAARGFPLPGDFEVQLASETEEAAGFTGVSASSVDEVAEFFRTALPDADYEIVRDDSPRDGIVLMTFEGAEISGDIAVSAAPNGDGTTIIVTINPQG